MNKDNKPVVLIVDDEKLCVKLLETIIGNNNYETLKAYNGKEALSILEQKPNIDLILLDIQMPEIDGFDLCSIIKNNKAYKNIPIIFLTGFIDEERQLKAFNLGAVDFISKPIKEKIVKARVAAHINLKLKSDYLEIMLLEKKKLIGALDRALRQVTFFWILTIVLFAILVVTLIWALFK